MEEENDSKSDEFINIIKLLDNRNLAILHEALNLKLDDFESDAVKKYLRDMKSVPLNGTLYNAYCARVLVLDPINYIKNEIILRFITGII